MVRVMMRWALGLTVGVALVGPLTGCDRLLNLPDIQVTPTSPPPNVDNGYTCVCTCSGKGMTAPTTMVLSVCNPPGFDPNTGGTMPSPAMLMSDCQSDRVVVQVQKMMGQCYLRTPTCTCQTADPVDTFYDVSCSGSCGPVPLDATCSNWNPKGTKTATCFDTACPSPGPVCVREKTDPATPTPSALVAAMMGRTTACAIDETTSTMSVTADGATEISPVQGEVDFAPAPSASCSSGQSCMSLTYRIDAKNPLSWSGLLGLESVTLSDIKTVGATTAFGLDSSTGAGLVASGTMQGSGRLREEQSNPISTDTSGQAGAGANHDAINVTFDGANFTLQGNILGSLQDQSNSSGVQVNIGGGVLNSPPNANLGSDRNVECTSTAGASVTLDASASSDAENNIVAYEWFLGTRYGSDLGGGADAKLTLQQGLGAQTYFVKTIDAKGQADEASATITVVDSTPPTIACNNPATMTPSSVPRSFTASASDTCSATSTAVVTGYTCFKRLANGKTTVKVDSCRVKIGGGTITIIDSGGVDDIIQWTVSGQDTHGNSGTATCTINVGQS
jgi:hypothetical protein